MRTCRTCRTLALEAKPGRSMAALHMCSRAQILNVDREATWKRLRHSASLSASFQVPVDEPVKDQSRQDQ